MNIILDIDGTLWDTTEVVARAWNRATKHIKDKRYDNYIITAETLKHEFGKPMIVIVEDLYPTLDKCERENMMEIVGAYEKEEMEADTSNLTYDGVYDTLRELAVNNNLYIVSNCRNGYIEFTLDRIGIRDIIKDYECYGHTGLYKTENIRLLMERNNLKEALYVGDTEGDYISAKEAGLKFAYASYGFGSVPDYDYKLSEFSDLLKIK